MFRYSMMTLLVVVSVLALFAAAFANPSTVFVRTIVSLTMLVLASCTFVAALGRSRSPFILGFVMAGWSYYVLTSGFPFHHQDRQIVATEWALDEFADTVHPDLEGLTYPSRLYIGYSLSGDRPEEKKLRFARVGHCLFTFIFATIGGLAAIWLRRPTLPNK